MPLQNLNNGLSHCLVLMSRRLETRTSSNMNYPQSGHISETGSVVRGNVSADTVERVCERDRQALHHTLQKHSSFLCE